MPTLNQPQGTPEIPGFQPGAFEVSHEESREIQEAREGEARIGRAAPDQEPKPETESREAIKQRILQQAESVKPVAPAPRAENNPMLNQLLTDVVNGNTPYEDLVLKTGADAEQAVDFVNNLGK